MPSNPRFEADARMAYRPEPSRPSPAAIEHASVSTLAWLPAALGACGAATLLLDLALVCTRFAPMEACQAVFLIAFILTLSSELVYLYRSAQIEKALFVAKGTVNSCRARGYKALGVSNKQELAGRLIDVAAARSPRVEIPREEAAARDFAQAQGGVGLAVLLIIALAILADWLSGGAVR